MPSILKQLQYMHWPLCYPSDAGPLHPPLATYSRRHRASWFTWSVCSRAHAQANPVEYKSSTLELDWTGFDMFLGPDKKFIWD